jgi:hypothetical protein|tara:strand:- start:823 stop:1323 length:501 start_codon:yes stop_codon:yes gene_type:complete
MALEFIKSASGSTVSSLSATDCFSADYDIYQVTVTTLQTSTSANIDVRFIDTGGVVSTSTYDEAILILPSNTGFSTIKNTGQTSIGGISFGNGASTGASINMMVFNPNDSSLFTYLIDESNAWTGVLQGYKGIGVEKTAQTITGINFFPSAGTVTMEIKVYGLKVA